MCVVPSCPRCGVTAAHHPSEAKPAHARRLPAQGRLRSKAWIIVADWRRRRAISVLACHLDVVVSLTVLACPVIAAGDREATAGFSAARRFPLPALALGFYGLRAAGWGAI
jgi:hypothetical protein